MNHGHNSLLRTYLPVSAMAFALLGQAAQGQQAERFEISGSHVAVYNLIGEVTVEPGSGSAVVVEVTRQGPDAAQLGIERGPIRGRETLRVIYPSDEIVYPERQWGRMDVRVRDDGTFSDTEGRRRNDWRESGNRVRIKGSGVGFEASADLRIQIPSGQRFALYLAAGRVSASNLNGEIRLDTHSAPVTASNTRGTLVIDVGSGSVNVTDHEGDADLDTGSGSVEATGVRGDLLRIDTGSGSITASQIAVSSLDLDTGSGGIDASNATARRVRLDTGSGSVRIDLASVPEDVEIDTGSGNVTMIVPESFSARVDIDTGSGEIDLDFPLTVRRWERSHVMGTIGDGSGRLTVDTGSGDVRIRKRG